MKQESGFNCISNIRKYNSPYDIDTLSGCLAFDGETDDEDGVTL